MAKLNKPGSIHKRVHLQVTIGEDTLAWVDSIIGRGKPLCDRSHTVEWALVKLKEKMEKRKRQK